MKPVEILDSFKQALGDALLDNHTVERSVGVKNPQAVYDVWTTVPPERLHDAVAHLCRQFNPHISVISGDDLGDEVALNYHFTVGWSERAGEITFTIRTVLKKSDLRLPTITDLFSGALTSEREKQEFYGISFDGIPDGRNLFLPEDATIHPWRKDLEEETAGEVKRLVKWETRNE